MNQQEILSVTLAVYSQVRTSAHSYVRKSCQFLMLDGLAKSKHVFQT